MSDSPPTVTGATRPLVVYHGPYCVDGFTSAWVARRYFKGEADFLPANYGDPAPDVAGRDVFVLDFSWKRPEMVAILMAARSVVVLDHHKSAREELRGMGGFEFGPLQLAPQIVFDMNHSGAMLAWQHFFGGAGEIDDANSTAPRLVRYVQDHDLWRFLMPRSREIQAAISSFPTTFEVWDALDSELSGDSTTDALVAQGGAILRYQGRLIERAVANCWEEEIGGHKVKVVNVSEASLISEVAGRLAECRPFGATFYVNARGERVYSARSRDGGVDVSEAAQQFGGGGHRQAAGWKVAPGIDPSAIVRHLAKMAKEGDSESAELLVRSVIPGSRTDD